MPSSQISPVSLTPLPQTGTSSQGCPGRGHTKPGSRLQSALQPSPDTSLRSSHVSEPFTRPSPQS
ncbi:hypothetical protein BE20_13970 [Sorangium cellulosum]|nr:hypothetical protein BE20_13970 [Sorangium cellulosum]